MAHIGSHIIGADACRWRTCNRIPVNNDISDAERERWIARHVLSHGPFYEAPEIAADTKEGEKRSKDGGDAAAADLFALAKSIRDEKSQQLLAVSPLFSNGYVPATDQLAHEMVLRLTMQGIGLIDQLQTWADRKEGLRGLQDKARVWRSADEVVERLAFVAVQALPTANYALRLIGLITNSTTPILF
ncbi:hypothetical protein IWW38_005574 [Coemansia aciculifera]|uniref:Uncharacterized protein n=1 Tax=Coemansia aciculifera TaxID=417176 RepID=A0ACC1LV89_9FUNG|nr:hypothetical protein IWW38_005574 [Coemansia aciculifera]